MEKALRFKLYINFLNSNNSVTLKYLLAFAEKKSIPSITVRRDVKELIKTGNINNELGILTVSSNYAGDFEQSRAEKVKINVKEKRETAEIAAKFMTKQTIFVGSGTTCEFLIPNIKSQIKVLYTNGLEIARLAMKNSNILKVTLLGGNLRKMSATLYGPLTNESISNLSFEQSFITATNIDINLDLFNDNEDEAFVLGNIIKKTVETFCLIDEHKFIEKGVGSRIVNAKDLKNVVTNKKPSLDFGSKTEINNIVFEVK